MPFNTVQLKPGVITQFTQAQNEAGVSISNLIRYHDGLIQKIGGWQKYYSGTLSSTIRDIHAWQGLQSNKYVAIGTTEQLATLHSGSLTDITPQTRTSDFPPAFSITSGSCLVTVIDNGSSASTFDSVFFNTQVSIGNILLQGAYQIQTVGGSSSYTVASSIIATTTINSSGHLPLFDATIDSAQITVTLPNNNYKNITGLFEAFYAPTTVGGQTIQGPYQINSIIDSTSFTIVAPTQAAFSDTEAMNGGLAEVVYYIGIGPPASGSGYGIGGYGLGGYGMGSPVIGSGGVPITATDWTMDNWGEALIACPTDGPIYVWSPDSGFSTATVVPGAPFVNGGIFISQPQQILVAWRSVQSTGVQDQLIVRWSDAGDYTNWVVSNQTSAGSFHIPTGSTIVGGLQSGTKGVIWTDVDCWIMSYVSGNILVFNFTRIGSGCGLIGKHAAGVLNEVIYWCGTNNFFILSGDGVVTLPCSVWDFVFQNIHRSYTDRILCAPNSMFNEINWYFPSAASTGENDSYVKYNVIEKEWDYGILQRTAWSDVTAVGNPIGTDISTVFQHELTNDADGIPISPNFESGYWTIAEGNELAFVDWILPDMKFGLYGQSQNASCQITLKTLNYVGDTPTLYGPYTFSSSTKYINTRLRGRFMSISITSNDIGSFWRIGAVKYRYSASGRR